MCLNGSEWWRLLAVVKMTNPSNYWHPIRLSALFESIQLFELVGLFHEIRWDSLESPVMQQDRWHTFLILNDAIWFIEILRDCTKLFRVRSWCHWSRRGSWSSFVIPQDSFTWFRIDHLMNSWRIAQYSPSILSISTCERWLVASMQNDLSRLICRPSRNQLHGEQERKKER